MSKLRLSKLRSVPRKKPNSEIYTYKGSMGAELLGLEPPFSSAPTVQNKHFFYISKGDRRVCLGFAADYASKKFLDLLLSEDEVHRTRGITGKEDTLVTSTGIVIRCDTLDHLLDYKLTEDEKKWEFPDSGNGGSLASIMSIRSNQVERGGNPKQDRVSVIKPDKVKKPSIDKSGLISIADIAQELKIEPREARAILRAQRVDKPEVGWAWSKLEVDAIKTLLHNHKE